MINISTRRVIGDLNSEYIFNNTNDLELWHFALGFYINIGEKFKNPARNDRYPGCKLNYRRGKLVIKDFAWEHNGCDAIEFIQVYQNLTYHQCLRHIKEELIDKRTCNNTHQTNTFLRKKYNKEFKLDLRFKVRYWNSNDKEFWKPYYITKANLEEDEVLPVQTFWFNTQAKPEEFVCIRAKGQPCYTIPVKDREKIYFPNGNPKWLGNWSSEHIGGKGKIDLEEDYFIVTKSYKDWRVLMNCGFTNCRFITTGEHSYPPKGFLEFLYKNFEHVIFLMDNDEAGIKASEKLMQDANRLFQTNIFFGTHLPTQYFNKFGITDPADFVKPFGQEKLINQINNIINEAYESKETFHPTSKLQRI